MPSPQWFVEREHKPQNNLETPTLDIFILFSPFFFSIHGEKMFKRCHSFIEVVVVSISSGDFFSLFLFSYDLSFHFYLSLYLHVYPFFSLSNNLSTYSSTYLSSYSSICLSISPSLYLSSYSIDLSI